MKLSKAIEGFLISYEAADYSPRTIRLHRGNPARLLDFLGDVEFEAITLDDLEAFMIYLKKEYKPKRFSDDPSPLSGSARANYWKSIRRLFRWASDRYEYKDLAAKIRRPRYLNSEVKPFTDDELKAIVYNAEYVECVRDGVHFREKLAKAKRNRALVLLMLDTGLRLGEIVRLKVGHINLTNGDVEVKPHNSGIKSHPRTVKIGLRTKEVLRDYMQSEGLTKHNDSLFGLAPSSIQSFFQRLQERSSVPNVHPHRFRHTFAVNYLRAGGDPWTLKYFLGHHSLEMVERYLTFSQRDLEESHAKGSPVDRLRL